MRSILAAPLLLLVLTLLLLGSCSRGQKGRFAISGMASAPLIRPIGRLVWADGQALDDSNHPVGVTYRLLTALIICPRAKGLGGSTGSESGEYVASFTEELGAGKSQVQVSFTWDRRTDVIEVEGVQFNRSQGSVIVIIKEPGKAAQAWQIEEPSGGIGADHDLVDQIKARLPNVAAVQDVDL